MKEVNQELKWKNEYRASIRFRIRRRLRSLINESEKDITKIDKLIEAKGYMIHRTYIQNILMEEKLGEKKYREKAPNITVEKLEAILHGLDMSLHEFFDHDFFKDTCKTAYYTNKDETEVRSLPLKASLKEIKSLSAFEQELKADKF